MGDVARTRSAVLTGDTAVLAEFHPASLVPLGALVASKELVLCVMDATPLAGMPVVLVHVVLLPAADHKVQPVGAVVPVVPMESKFCT